MARNPTPQPASALSLDQLARSVAGERVDVVVVVAHPDDEIFVSGLLCLCAERGLRTALICVTNGENGSLRLMGAGDGPDRLAAIRRRELALSAMALGVAELWFLDQPDVATKDWGVEAVWRLDQLGRDLVRLFLQLKPRLILTHGPLGGYGHPAHSQVFVSVEAAAVEAAFAGAIYSFCGQVKGAFFRRQFDQASDVLVNARGFLDQRATSLSYHQSQIGDFIQPYWPRTIKSGLSALVGLGLWFTDWGHRRIPIGDTTRYFRLFPVEGLVLQKAADHPDEDLLSRSFRDDPRVTWLTAAGKES